MSEGRSTAPFSSSRTAPCIWPVRPSAAMGCFGSGAAAMASRMASCAARHQSSGSCSAQPGCGVRKGAWSLAALEITLPLASTMTARVPPVPTSIPRNHITFTPSCKSVFLAVTAYHRGGTKGTLRRRTEQDGPRLRTSGRDIASRPSRVFASEHPNVKADSIEPAEPRKEADFKGFQGWPTACRYKVEPYPHLIAHGTEVP